VITNAKRKTKSHSFSQREAGKVTDMSPFFRIQCFNVANRLNLPVFARVHFQEKIILIRSVHTADVGMSSIAK